jgi:hypothetical protein
MRLSLQSNNRLLSLISSEFLLLAVRVLSVLSFAFLLFCALVILL